MPFNIISQEIKWTTVPFDAISPSELVSSGIIDPTQLILKEINSIDMNTKQSKLVQNLLLGEDEYAMEYISAYRSGDL